MTRRSEKSNFALNARQEENIDTKLYPFRPNTGSWYTSNDVKRTEPFGYTYPETANLAYPPSEDAKEKLRDRLDEEYPSPAKLIRQSKLHSKTAGLELLPRAHILGQIEAKEIPATVDNLESIVQALPKREELLEISLQPSKPVLRDLAPDNKYLEWLTNIQAQKHTLDGAFTIHLFLGPTDQENTALWPTAPHHVGTISP